MSAPRACVNCGHRVCGCDPRPRTVRELCDAADACCNHGAAPRLSEADAAARFGGKVRGEVPE